MTDQELLFLLEHDPEAGIHELMQMYGGAIYTICKNFLSECPESDVEETQLNLLLPPQKTPHRRSALLSLLLCI